MTDDSDEKPHDTPDVELVEQFEHASYRCTITRVRCTGTLCGYVDVLVGHPWFGCSIDDLGPVEVHGGITWSARAPDGDAWRVGFDCSHGGLDGLPFVAERLREACGTVALPPTTDPPRSVEFVRQQCRSLAEQATGVCLLERDEWLDGFVSRDNEGNGIVLKTEPYDTPERIRAAAAAAFPLEPTPEVEALRHAGVKPRDVATIVELAADAGTGESQITEEEANLLILLPQEIWALRQRVAEQEAELSVLRRKNAELVAEIIRRRSRPLLTAEQHELLSKLVTLPSDRGWTHLPEGLWERVQAFARTVLAGG